MIRRQKRLTSLLLLAAYLSASTVGGLLHSHEHAPVARDLPKQACNKHSHSHHEHQHAGHSHAGHKHSGRKHADHDACRGGARDSARTPHSPEHHDHDDCTVCRFLGQVSLPVQVAAADMPLGLSVEIPATFLAAPRYGVPRATLHLRAGPTAA